MNLLPRDGNVTYHPNFLKPEEADSSLQLILKTQEWQPDVVKMFGKEITTGRKVIWYGDPNCTYTYSGKLKTPTPWHALVLQLKTITELNTNHLYNSCLANLYHNGDEGMGWHSDNEKELGKEPNISVISLGAERKFKFKHRQNIELITPFAHRCIHSRCQSTRKCRLAYTYGKLNGRMSRRIELALQTHSIGCIMLSQNCFSLCHTILLFRTAWEKILLSFCFSH